MSYDNMIYRVADPVSPPVARPPIYGGGSVGGGGTSTPGSASKPAGHYYLTADGTMVIMPAPTRHPEPGMGSQTTSTPNPRPPSTGGGKGSKDDCPKGQSWVCWDYLLDPMYPAAGTGRRCECVAGGTAP